MNQRNEDRFIITSGERKFSYAMIGVGVLSLLIGVILAFTGGHIWAGKVWIALLANSLFFLGLALAGMFFITSHQLALGGWYVVFRRVPEAMSQYLPVAGLLMLPIIIGMWTHSHHLYHWADPEAVAHDALIRGKTGFLNPSFFTLRYVIYFALWILLALLWRRASLKEDMEGGLKYYKKRMKYSAIFTVVFAVTSSTMAWDYLMSIDTHWYSTLYGWYVFMSFLVAGIAAMILIITYLKSRSYLPAVNSEHLHDLGKYLFGFSVFWTYLWFSQFMLIWYGNIGEETIYFKSRMEHYPFLFYFMLVINFIVPFFALMTRDAKRKVPSLVIISVLLLFGHWLDFYLMIAPGASANEVHFGFFELGLTAGYFGLFLLVVFRALAQARLSPVKDPFYKESLEHHT